MGNDRIPIIREKIIAHQGYFNIKAIENHLKSYMEDTRHYDLSEKDYEERNEPPKKALVIKLIAEQEYTDYYKIVVKFEINMNGVDTTVEINGKPITLQKGVAKLTINAFIEPDFQNKRGTTAVAKFLDKLYNAYIGKDEMQQCIFSCVKDVGELVSRFRQEVNSTIK